MAITAPIQGMERASLRATFLVAYARMGREFFMSALKATTVPIQLNAIKSSHLAVIAQ
jgi:hypothetical protein